MLDTAVDTRRFCPAETPRPPEPLRLLLAGSHWQRYRVETAVAVLKHVRAAVGNAELLVAGRFCWGVPESVAHDEVRAMAERYGVAGAVTLRGPYRQAAARDLFVEAHVLIHPKVNDPCPTLVLEAMACGLPVIYSASGGTPELVGPDAGIGVPSDTGWDRASPPDPERMADAVVAVARELPRYSSAARARAVARFDVTAWLARHAEIFEKVAQS